MMTDALFVDLWPAALLAGVWYVDCGLFTISQCPHHFFPTFFHGSIFYCFPRVLRFLHLFLAATVCLRSHLPLFLNVIFYVRFHN